MSIESRKRRGRDGKAYSVYRVRWRDDTGSFDGKTLPRGTTRKEAEAFERRVKLLKATGELPELEIGKETLATFAEEWWDVYAGPNLAVKTLDTYAQMFNRHVLPRLGHYRLRELTPGIIARWRADLERDGVGAPTVIKVLSILQGILSRAVEWGRLKTNPAAAVRKPPARRSREIIILAPRRVELLRSHFLALDRRRDAALVSVLAYSGPRPGEALRMRWKDLGERTLRWRSTKTAKRTRTTRLLSPLRQDLLQWRMASPHSGLEDLVFPKGNGEPMPDHRNWRSKVFKPAAQACGLDAGVIPYDLRHSFASLLLHEGCSVIEVAQELGHSPQMTLSTYGHVIAELADADRVSAEDTIRAARETGLGSQTSLGAM